MSTIDGKKITSIQTWAGMDVAMCSDGTIWEACPIFEMESTPAGGLVLRLARMEWRRVADGRDLHEPATESQGCPERRDPDLAQEEDAVPEIAHLRPKEAAEGLKQRMMREPFEEGAPDWYLGIELRTLHHKMVQPVGLSTGKSEEAFVDRAMLMAKLREAVRVLCAVVCTSDADTGKYIRHFLQNNLGFKKI